LLPDNVKEIDTVANFLEKWSSKKADKPKAGAKNVVETFLGRVAEQKLYLLEFERDASSFNKWRSTWFQRAPGGFGITIGRDSVDAGRGLNYVVVETVAQVAEFLDDLARHAENDAGFQQALEQNRQRRATALNSAKSASASAKAKTVKSPTKAKEKSTDAASVTEAVKPKRGRKPKTEGAAS